MYIEALVGGKEASYRSMAAPVASKVVIGAGDLALFYRPLLHNVVGNSMRIDFRSWDDNDKEMLRGVVEHMEKGSLITDGAIDSSIASDAKKVLVGAGARALFYPTLLYNVVRNKMQTDFRWWDRVDKFILLGAVPFPSDVPRLKELGVGGVITLNEPYETLVPSYLYQAHNIDHLVIATRDYCFAPSLSYISQAVDFIHKNASAGRVTYVHCKAGRGRSTTVVICYLVQHKQMSPDTAYDYVKSIRPRVCLASSQWQAVQEFYHFKVKKAGIYSHATSLPMNYPMSSCNQDLAIFNDSSVVVVTESDLDGYDPTQELKVARSGVWTDLSVVYQVRKAALARISCLWLRYHSHQNITTEKIGIDSIENIRVDIHVY